eukprot:scaffold72776_cov69-Phaeocystis_antarctica.AAC.2
MKKCGSSSKHQNSCNDVATSKLAMQRRGTYCRFPAHVVAVARTLRTRYGCAVGSSLLRSRNRRQSRRFPARQFPTTRAAVAQACLYIPMVYPTSRRVVAGMARQFLAPGWRPQGGPGTNSGTRPHSNVVPTLSQSCCRVRTSRRWLRQSPWPPARPRPAKTDQSRAPARVPVRSEAGLRHI